MNPPVSLPVQSDAPRVPVGPERRHLLGDDRDSLVNWLIASGHPRFRADQILQWIYARGTRTFEGMTNLSKSLRAELDQQAVIMKSSIAGRSVSEDGTTKLLLEFPDSAKVEAVWIPADPRHTACISSQVGCPVGCRFCASGLDGVERNLKAGEIVEQALRISDLITAQESPSAPREDARLSNIVFMGMGEPLANYAEVVRAIRILNADWGLNIGARRITVSTVGLPKQIRMLAQEGLQVNLALSLHAPFDKLREELIPWARGIPISDLIDACRFFFDQTGREITLEYALLNEVNMSVEHAEALTRIVRSMRANVNLLRYNPVPGLPYGRPAGDASYAFQQRLRELGVNAHLRRSRGRDVDAACGQLRRRTSA